MDQIYTENLDLKGLNTLVDGTEFAATGDQSRLPR